jgi:hypothetical protein
MRTLLLAAILYLIGVVVILLLRPRMMFNEDGNWKEFGIVSKSHTVFPLWLFCILWAVVSYCITLFFIGLPNTEHPKHYSTDEPIRPNPRSGKRSKSGKRSNPVQYPSENLVEPLTPMPEIKSKNPPKPGYYVLNNKGTNAEGTPRYVYYGPEPPGTIGEE